MWKFIKDKEPKGLMELTLSMRVKEMAENTYATNSFELENNFKRVLEEEMPKRNAIRAWHSFKLTFRNQSSVEIWKLDIKGEFKHKMFTLTYEKAIV